MNTKLTDLIKEYPSIIPVSLCEDIVCAYERSPSREMRSERLAHFEQVWMRIDPELYKLQLIVYNYVATCIQDYMLDLQHTSMFPPNFDYEPFKIKKYKEGDYFNRHVDVSSAENMRRFLSVSVYLTDNGGTSFFDDYVVGGSAGSVLIFPPLWMFPHSAVVNGGGKYFLNTYLTYK